jgi:hypothetical protein
MVRALEQKQATENLSSGWLFESGVPNPQLTRQKIVLKVCPYNLRAVQQFFLLEQEARS